MGRGTRTSSVDATPEAGERQAEVCCLQLRETGNSLDENGKGRHAPADDEGHDSCTSSHTQSNSGTTPVYVCTHQGPIIGSKRHRCLYDYMSSRMRVNPEHAEPGPCRTIGTYSVLRTQPAEKHTRPPVFETPEPNKKHPIQLHQQYVSETRRLRWPQTGWTSPYQLTGVGRVTPLTIQPSRGRCVTTTTDVCNCRRKTRQKRHENIHKLRYVATSPNERSGGWQC